MTPPSGAASITAALELVECVVLPVVDPSSSRPDPPVVLDPSVVQDRWLQLARRWSDLHATARHPAAGDPGRAPLTAEARCLRECALAYRDAVEWLHRHGRARRDPVAHALASATRALQLAAEVTDVRRSGSPYQLLVLRLTLSGLDLTAAAAAASAALRP